MSGPLEGAVALVTGASSGIGEATVRKLADLGAAVAGVARRIERLEELAKTMGSNGKDVIAVEADLTSASQADDAVRRTVGDLGRLDIVVNNAGTMLVGPVAQAPNDEWDRMININLRGVLNVARPAIPHLIEAAQSSPRRIADMVNISSTAGRTARPGTAVYSLTKFGVNGFSEALRQELQPERVRVGVVEPGTVDTELGSHSRDGIREGIEKRMSAMKLLNPEDIADAIAYIITRERHVAVNEMLVRASDQSW